MLPSTQRRIVLFYLALLSGGWSADAAEIQFKAKAETRGSIVLLGDIAEVRGADSEQLERLRRIELFPSPARGRARTLRDVELRQLLQLHEVQAADHQFTGAELVRIEHGNIVPSKSASVAAAPEESTVLVAKRAIAVGEVLRAVDLELKTLTKPAVNFSLIKTATVAEQVIGHECTRAFDAGQPIDVRSLRKPLLVRRGEQISVTAKAAGVRVRTTVKALADGSLGDLIAVENLNKRDKKFSVVITGPREAEIFASASIVPDTSRTTQVGDKQ